MRILILTYNFGEGHNSAARSIEKELKSRNIFCYKMSFEMVMNRSKEALIKNIGNFLLMGKGRLNQALYKVSNNMDEFNIKSSVYLFNKSASKRLYTYIKENKFDLVICTHLFPSECMTAVNKNYKKINFINISTDYCYIPFLNEITPDYYVIPHKDLIDDFVNKNISKSKLLPFGIPIERKFSEVLDKNDTRKILNLPLKKHIVLFMSGGTGYGDVLNQIKGFKSDTILIVACGNNIDLYNKVKNLNQKNIIPLPFVNNIDEYMSACDILVTKPGGLSTTEGAAKEIPIIHTKPIPGVEPFNKTFFNDKGMSVYTDKEIHRLVEKLLKDKKLLKEISKSQKENINKNSTKDICDFIEKTYKNDII